MYGRAGCIIDLSYRATKNSCKEHLYQIYTQTDTNSETHVQIDRQLETGTWTSRHAHKYTHTHTHTHIHSSRLRDKSIASLLGALLRKNQYP